MHNQNLINSKMEVTGRSGILSVKVLLSLLFLQIFLVRYPHKSKLSVEL